MSFAALLKQREQDPAAWRYTQLAPFAAALSGKAQAKIKFLLPDSVAPQRLVFLDGQFRADLSVLDGLPDGFCRAEEGAVVLAIAAQTCLALQPLEMLFLSGAARENAPKIKLRLGANARLTLIERHFHQGNAACASMPETEIFLEEQAKLVHGKIVSGGAKGLHLSAARISVASGAFYDSYGLVTDGALTREQTDVFLKGELAGAQLAGATLLRASAHADRVMRVFHEAPHGTSRQIFKNVLDGKAQAVFQGKIYVAAEAQKTDGHQLNRALLLSDKAEMDAVPELEIYADDVKCSHGSAVGDLDEQELFYLRSRGIGEKEARAMLIEAFVNDGIDRIQSAELAALAREEVKKWLKQ